MGVMFLQNLPKIQVLLKMNKRRLKDLSTDHKNQQSENLIGKKEILTR